MRRTLTALLLFFTTAGLSAAEVDFAHEIVPLLKQHCSQCHGGTQQKGRYSINTRESLLAGGESGVAVRVGKSRESALIERINSQDADFRMPPEGARLTATQTALLTRWIDSGATWEPGFSFGPRVSEPPLKPRRPVLPPTSDEHANPVDRILSAILAADGRPQPPGIDDATFQRRVTLDLIGLLPTPDEQASFLADSHPEKRRMLVHSLLGRDMDYAEHWLTFWNDLLRNDYTGTGFITGGRKQISRWLYDALVTNMPYDQFARELIAPPTPESAGFADGIRWRGEVSAGQTVEIQFAQSVGQTFLGINLKCASCHDSFIDRWTLDDAYGLAAIYSQRPLELHRCDQPLGKTAKPAWLFPELGQVDAQAAQPVRLKQLAALMTHRENGRFTRTIVNRLWHRLMGRGIVHPVDSMQSEPWSADLLDFLAEHLVENRYDLKQTLALIATSAAYQSRVERVTDETDAQGYHYAGPRARRLTAEQFVDCVWQLTEAAPRRFDAPIVRGKRDPAAAQSLPLTGVWIWKQAEVGNAAAGETIVFRKLLELKDVPSQVVAVVTCDNSYTLYVNGKRLQAGENWEAPDLVPLSNLKAGTNEILIVAKNGGSGPNPAGLFFEARWTDPAGQIATLGTNATWEWTTQLPDRTGKYKSPPDDWQPAVRVTTQQIWMSRLSGELATLLSQGDAAAGRMVRAGLVKSDFLMRSLGRPNRDQIVSVRPLELTTLEAIDLSNGEALASALRQGAARLHAQKWRSATDLVDRLYLMALTRGPTAEERSTLSAALGDEPTAAAIEDVLWVIVMLPEFQLVR